MSDFKTRLADERVELEEKLIQVQATAMNTYLQCLKERIERL